tara:strand:+ start:692 stop:1312 length:621 start_codon:yes stop_codon:yes gene_type:complete
MAALSVLTAQSDSAKASKTAKKSGVESDVRDVAETLARQPDQAFRNGEINFDRATKLDDIKTETDAYACIDQPLHSLRKDYKELQRRVIQARKDFGPDSPMVELLEDQLDSARSAMDTRLLEVKRDPKACALGLQLWLKAEEHIRKSENKKRQERFEAEMAAFSMAIKKMLERRKEKSGLGWLWLILFLAMASRNNQSTMQLNHRR